MSIQKKIFYSILFIFTIVYSFSTWFYYLHFQKALLSSHAKQVFQMNTYVFQDIKRVDARYQTLISTLKNDSDIASLYDHIPWLVTLSKKIARKNFEVIFQRNPYLQEVSFYQGKEVILTLTTQNSHSPKDSFVNHEEKLDFKDATLRFKVDIVKFIQHHIKKNNIQEPSFVYLQNNKGAWLINKTKVQTFKKAQNRQVLIKQERFLFSKAQKFQKLIIQSATSLQEVQEGLKNILYKFMFAYFFTASAIFFIAKYLASFITKPLNSLEEASKKIIARDFSLVNYKREDETKNAILAFNLMSQEIQTFTNNLQEQVKERTKELELLNQNLDKRVQEEVRKNQEQERLIFFQSKLATMGEVINIIAHQWKQPISVISSYLTNIQLKLTYTKQYDENEIIEAIDNAQEGLQHIASTITLFQSYLKPKQSAQKETFEIHDALLRCTKLFDSILKKYHIKVCLPTKGYIKIRGNQEYFIQVMLVLLNNAKDAFITSQNSPALIHFSLQEHENSIELSIKDNAGGIKIDTKSIFEPYISAKKSTGLGLFIAKNITEKVFNGSIRAQNTKTGAIFIISFPV